MYSDFPALKFSLPVTDMLAHVPPSPNAVVCVVKALIRILVEHKNWVLLYWDQDPACGITAASLIYRADSVDSPQGSRLGPKSFFSSP